VTATVEVVVNEVIAGQATVNISDTMIFGGSEDSVPLTLTQRGTPP
jgi:hypothetical protein